MKRPTIIAAVGWALGVALILTLCDSSDEGPVQGTATVPRPLPREPRGPDGNWIAELNQGGLVRRKVERQVAPGEFRSIRDLHVEQVLGPLPMESGEHLEEALFAFARSAKLKLVDYLEGEEQDPVEVARLEAKLARDEAKLRSFLSGNYVVVPQEASPKELRGLPGYDKYSVPTSYGDTLASVWILVNKSLEGHYAVTREFYRDKTRAKATEVAREFNALADTDRELIERVHKNPEERATVTLSLSQAAWIEKLDSARTSWFGYLDFRDAHTLHVAHE